MIKRARLLRNHTDRICKAWGGWGTDDIHKHLHKVASEKMLATVYSYLEGVSSPEKKEMVLR